jgi:hypothetical protein
MESKIVSRFAAVNGRSIAVRELKLGQVERGPLMSEITGNPPRLLDQVREVIRMRHYRIRTEEAYVQ